MRLRVEINDQNLFPQQLKAHGNVERTGCLADAPFLIAESDNVGTGHDVISCTSLGQGAKAPYSQLSVAIKSFMMATTSPGFSIGIKCPASATDPNLPLGNCDTAL